MKMVEGGKSLIRSFFVLQKDCCFFLFFSDMFFGYFKMHDLF